MTIRKKYRIALLALLLALNAPAVPTFAADTPDDYTWKTQTISAAYPINYSTVIRIDGTVTLNAPITITGGTVTIVGGTIKRGSGYTSDNLLNITGGDVTLENVTIDGGKVETRGVNHAGVYMTGGTLRIKSGTVFQNHCVYAHADDANYGQGSAIRQTGGNIIMTGGTVSGNRARNYGNIYVGAGARFDLNGGTVSGNALGNVPLRRGGGGFYVCGKLYVDGGTITNNSAAGSATPTFGGGIYCDGGEVHLKSGSVVGNDATNGKDIYAMDGGRIIYYDGSNTTSFASTAITSSTEASYAYTNYTVYLYPNGGTIDGSA